MACARKAINRAKLEPFLGFLHSVQFSKPSLICDLQELYQYMVDDFVLARASRRKVWGFRVLGLFFNPQEPSHH